MRYSGALVGLASRCQTRPASVVASRVPASPTAKQCEAVRHPMSYRVCVVPLRSACQATGSGAAGAAVALPVAQPVAADRARTASIVFMNYVVPRQAGIRDFDARTRLNPSGNRLPELAGKRRGGAGALVRGATGGP